MENGQLYLATVRWKQRDTIGDIAPGRFPVLTSSDSVANCYEAAIPAYARDSYGNGMQLAVKSQEQCFVVGVDSKPVRMAEYVHPDTGEHWWIEKGEWKRNEYHDAESFHRPGGTVHLRIGETDCRIHLYDPSLTASDFAAVLEDLKNWCWEMAIDESCYVTIAQDSDVRVLDPVVLRLAKDFVRYAATALDKPHRELREATSLQRVTHLRPNGHSLRFLAQCGDRPMVPGRAAAEHYNTPENRFLAAMISRVHRMVQATSEISGVRLKSCRAKAGQHQLRANELRSKTSEQANPQVFRNVLQKAREQSGIEATLLQKGFAKLKVTSERSNRGDAYLGEYDGVFALVSLGADDGSQRVSRALRKCGCLSVIGRFNVRPFLAYSGTRCCSVTISHVEHTAPWRDYAREVATAEQRIPALEQANWQIPIPAEELVKRRQEAVTLSRRAEHLQAAATRAATDATQAAVVASQAAALQHRVASLAITPDLRFIPSMVYLQSPPYTGAISCYRQLLALAGLDQTAMDDLLSLEDVGLRDWPGVYERWCLVALLRVLMDDFRFIFEKAVIRDALLRYCTGKREGSFSLTGFRSDMNLTVELAYQPTLPNRRRPDFRLTLGSPTEGRLVQCVLDAKACAFQHRPDSGARANATLYLDDCLQELIQTKNYGEDGQNDVFILHSASLCGCAECAASETPHGPVTHPTTMQSWANASVYGGDAVFVWESEPPQLKHGAVLVRPATDMSDLRRLVLMLIQFKLSRKDICPSCGSGGTDVSEEPGRGVGVHRRCRKCGFLSVHSHCYNCKSPIVKNQAWWSYQDSHPTGSWNIKCSSCGALL